MIVGCAIILSMQSILSDIIRRLEGHQFPNEQAIKQGVVLRLLDSLGWDIYDPKAVLPEFFVEGGHVDFALCSPPEHPQIFIEVKQSSTFNIGEDQLMMKYAFQHGVPIAVLTDGQRWSFYLPSGNGTFEERRFYLLDLLERNTDEIEFRLSRYLAFEEVKMNRASTSAREDHDDAIRRRIIAEALPEAWQEMVREADERLIQSLSTKIESTTGYQPKETEVAAFLRKQTEEANSPAPGITKRGSAPPQKRTSNSKLSKSESPIKPGGNWYSINSGDKQTFTKAIEATVEGLKELSTLVPDFMISFEKKAADFRAKKKSKGEKRRWVARNREDLYQNPKLISASKEIAPGWWLGTNYGNAEKRDMLKIARDVAARADIRFEFELE